MKIRVDVTQKDIDKGRKGSCSRCPIALGLKRATGDPKATAGYGECRWTHNGKPYKWVWVASIPDVVSGKEYKENGELISKFINDFDNWREVKPFYFEISFEMEF